MLDLRNTARVLDPTGISTRMLRTSRSMNVGGAMGVLEY